MRRLHSGESNCGLAILLGLLCSAAGYAQTGQPEKDRKLLQGKWEVVTIVSKAGVDEPKGGKMTMTVVGDRIISKDGDRAMGEATFTLDPAKMPKTMDLREIKGKNVFLGIYQLQGNELTLCFGPPNGNRPTEFAAQPGGTLSLITLKRMK